MKLSCTESALVGRAVLSLLSPSSWAPWTWDAEGSSAGDLGRVIFYVSVPVQLIHLSRLIPYRVGDVTGCSEGCVVIQSGLAEMSEMVVGLHYQDS